MTSAPAASVLFVVSKKLKRKKARAWFRQYEDKEDNKEDERHQRVPKIFKAFAVASKFGSPATTKGMNAILFSDLSFLNVSPMVCTPPLVAAEAAQAAFFGLGLVCILPPILCLLFVMIKLLFFEEEEQEVVCANDVARMF